MYVDNVGEDNVEDGFYKKFKTITQNAFVAFSNQQEQSSTSQGMEGNCYKCMYKQYY